MKITIISFIQMNLPRNIKQYLIRMKNKFNIVLLSMVLLLTACGKSQQTSDWRGPDRDGKYKERGLLSEWPAEGPEVVWTTEGLGQGFSSPAFANGKIYVTGMIDETGYLFILSEDGNIEKKFEYGPEFHESYPGTRSMPVVKDGLVYIASGMGKLLCLDADTGREIWSKDAVKDFGGTNIRWGITENLLIDGKRIFFTPGGQEHNIVALDRFNGDILMSSSGTGKGELSAYCSPLLVKIPEREILVTMMEENIVGVDANTGRLLWSHPHTNRNKIHANNPLYLDGSIFAFSAEAGSVKLKLSDDGSRVTEEWKSEMDPLQGGVVILDGYIYGSGNRNRGWFCVDWNSGETLWNSTELAWGAVIYADGRLYKYTERGELALVRPGNGNLDIVGQTSVTIGTEEHFAHPVINNGRLYVRRGNAMIAYNISG
jgi:outer membrane protein assembly factor BamB